MTQVVNEEQLDYCDVLIKPKRSTLNSRKEPNVYRNYTFKWSNRTIEGNGLTVANMATTGTFEMAKIFQHNKMFCCLQKHYSFDRLYEFFTENNLSAKTFDGHICGNDYIFLSTGINTEDINKTKRVLDMGLCKNLCIDIANGYIPKLLETVSLFRKEYPDIVIMVGNVVTGDMVQDLILAGADIVKCGIGPGCFTGDMKVQTKSGLKKIKDIDETDEVLTHTGQYHKVLNKFCYNHHKNIIKINNIECTPNHQFYIIDKKDKELINDDNYKKYAKWVSAEDLDEKNHLLLKIK